jgi:hypothetical protein
MKSVIPLCQSSSNGTLFHTKQNKRSPQSLVVNKKNAQMAQPNKCKQLHAFTGAAPVLVSPNWIEHFTNRFLK